MLKRKMLRDISEYKVQFISIFIMAFIGVFVYSGVIAEVDSFETTVNDYYADTNFADGWIYSNYLINESLKQVYLLGATEDMERQLVVDSEAKLENKPQVTLHFVENNTVSKFYTTEGDELDINDANGVWLDEKFAEARNLKIGDKITFETNGIEIEKEIKGLGYSPEYIYTSSGSSSSPNHTATGFAYMSYKAFPSSSMVYNVLNVKFEGTAETYSELLDYHLHGYYSAFLSRESHPSNTAVSESINQENALSTLFPSLFISISMLMLLTTMKRIISNQRTQIGILKANGFKNTKISMQYILSGFVIVTSASVLGVILGPIVFISVSYPSRALYYQTPYWHQIPYTEFIPVIILIGLLSILVTHLSIKNIINEPPSLIIKPKAPSQATSGFVEKLGIWKRLPFKIRWNYRDAKRNKFRVAMTIVGVIGCSVLLISAFGISEKIDETQDWYFDDVIHFESKLIIDGNTTSSQIDAVAQKVNGEEIMEATLEIGNDNVKVGSLLALNGGDLITMTNDDKEKIEIGNDEVSISKKMADQLKVNVGDTVNCRIVGSDKWVKIKIDKIHSSPFSQGLVMSPEKMKKVGLNYTPTSIVTQEHVDGHYDGIKSIAYKSDLLDSWNQMLRISLIIIKGLIAFAVILAVVILYNLNMLSFIEMKSDIATLKVLGFKSRYLTALLATQSLFIIVISFILSIPIGYQVLAYILPSFGSKLYMLPSLSSTNLFLTFVIIISVSLFTLMLFSKKIRKLDMLDSIKSFE